MLEEGWGTSEHEQTITSVISEGEKERKKSQEDLDTETSLSMPSVLCPSPQELGVKIMTDQHSMNTSPCPPEASRSALGDTPSPDQKIKISNESCEIKTAPSTNPERTEGQKNKVEWNFINVNNYTVCIKMSDKEVLDHIKQNSKKNIEL
ncbi:uncharacterized protein LOC131363247 isoform X3 [Hemibagrus wyckioides]|uniref:uncharacterized protein LOC131363247 isoform X3 n=1 Tax=Hemibagrus wyckioides TaxID=337641 RepID=UPI00266CBA9B|nr:uncharacterized protein LOC131363247 isoform X3 [Hemibagrus wyckioides]